jgi:replicative superfamily II helicase
MAAVQAARQNRKVFYPVPLKALAEEKYQELWQRYASAGIRVIVSSRDHSELDADLVALDLEPWHRGSGLREAAELPGERTAEPTR